MRIGGWHSNEPTWRDTSYEKTGTLIGIELEVHNAKGRQRAADCLDTVNFGKYPVPIAERDGSLDEELGVEIILPPLPLKEIEAKDGYVARLMDALKESGCTKNSTKVNGYGMHININMDGWSDKEKLLVQYLINLFAEFGTKVGRRKEGHGGYHPVLDYTRGELHTYFGDRHCAAYIRGSGGVRTGTAGGKVMEVRFPKTTLEIANLHEALNYVLALRNWVKAAPNHTEAICFLNASSAGQLLGEVKDCFLDWCAKYAPDVIPTISDRDTVEYRALKRFDYVAQAAKNRTNVRFTFERVGLNDKQEIDGGKKQALELSTLLSKGAGVQNQLAKPKRASARRGDFD
jgi:hypothetical protein